MLTIEILSDEIKSVSGEFEGRPYMKRTQKAYAHLPNSPYPVEFELRLEKDQAPYPKGKYDLSPEIFTVWNGKLQFSRYLKLVHLQQSRAA